MSVMNPEVEARFERIEALLFAIAESQAKNVESQAIAHANLEANLAKTEAIANSNARAIEATANQGLETKRNLAELVGIVSNFVKATNSRLIALEDR